MSSVTRRSLVTAGSGLALASAIGLNRPAIAQQQAGTTVDVDAYSFMSSDPRLTIWVQLIAAGGQEQYARAPTPYTMFPASNAAFAEMPAFVNSLLAYQNSTGTHNAQDAFPDTSKIVELVRSHVVRGKHYPQDVMGRKITVTTIAGTQLEVDGTDPSAVRLNWASAANGEALSARLVDQPITCRNAVLYIVDHIGRL